MKVIGKVAAIEKNPTTIDEFYFWTEKERILNPFDVVKVEHINNSSTFGVIEEISHITDTPSYLTSYVSNDFGDVNCTFNTKRIGMNFVKARVVGNTRNIYIPVLDGSPVMFANQSEIEEALGLKDVENPLVCGYIEMYEYDKENKITLPVHFNSKFLLGPEGAHLNISGISGLAAKTSYAMFLLKAIQQANLSNDNKADDDVAYVLFNVKGCDLLTIDEPDLKLDDKDKNIYEALHLDITPFSNVKYFYPYSNNDQSNTYQSHSKVKAQMDLDKAHYYKYIYEDDKPNLDLLFSNIDDPNQTIDSILNYIISERGNFGNIRDWSNFEKEVSEQCKTGKAGKPQDDRGGIVVQSWWRFKRYISKPLSNKALFSNRASAIDKEVRLQDAISRIKKNDVFVVDIAKLGEGLQSFVFGDVIRAIYDLKLGQIKGVEEKDIPSKIVIFIDELNKYASSDVPKSSPILRQIIDITERGRSLGIVLFSAEQFKSAIHDRVKGNCSTHAYGRTNAIEISKKDYQYIPKVYKGMMTRLIQGEYILQNPIFRSLLHIKFPKPLYRQVK